MTTTESYSRSDSTKHRKDADDRSSRLKSADAQERADECIREHEQLASRRGIWEGHWREVAERVRPNQNFFQNRARPNGDKRNEKIFDDTAPLALSKFAAAVISMSFPATQRYHALTTHDPVLAKNTNVKRYLE
ncbi:MAG TPA: portal protein, partial [Burkholderiales bacterium]|nr:portal protein [Burkholderiales bacterium]